MRDEEANRHHWPGNHRQLSVSENRGGGGEAAIAFLYDADRGKAAQVPGGMVVATPDEMIARGADLVVEAAHPQAVRDFGPVVVCVADFVPFSLTAFSDDEFRKIMEESAHVAGNAIYVPHGAVLALDGIADGRTVLESVRIATVKHPKSLGVSPEGIDQPVTL